MAQLKQVCVFCGSSPGSQPEYAEAARTLGQALAKRGIGLVYGGGRVGMMGILARAALAAGGSVTGVIPQDLASKNMACPEVSDMRIVDHMHARKAMMAELSDGFIALPGGYGTLEEIFEVITWAQLGLHHKPCGFLNIRGFYNPLIQLLNHFAEENFIGQDALALAQMAEDPEDLLAKFEVYQPPFIDKVKWARNLEK